MDETLTKIIDLIPPKWRTTVLVLFLISPYFTRAYYSLRNNGGLKGVLASIWLGTNTPKTNEKTTTNTGTSN